MIERFFLKDCINFDEVELEFDNGLILFSGASGAGKSVFFNALLGVFGIKEMEAKSAEVAFDNYLENLDEFGLENDEPNIIRYAKTKSARYFFNSSQVSKKTIQKITSKMVDYLSLKESKEFENERILSVLDEIISKKDSSYKEKILKKYHKDYSNYIKAKEQLNEIIKQEQKIEELKEFALYEIEKIERISPKIGEYEELMEIKKSISKKEKIAEAISKAETIFEYERYIGEALDLLEIDSTFMDESLNELRSHFESAKERLDELEDVNIEEVLDRLEALSSLKQKFGSIEGALKHLKVKKEELERYENIAYKKDILQKKVDEYLFKAKELSDVMTKKREEALMELNKKINSYLKELYLQKVTLSLKEDDLSSLGKDRVSIDLWGIDLQKISTGEFNRVKLAFLSSYNEIIDKKMHKILILDEADANLSGKESMSIAKVLKKLSKNYQIFAISHQPQLTSFADMHFLVYKDNGVSKIKELKTKEQRVEELSRMISGDKVHHKAKEFAKSLFEEGNNDN